MRQRGLAKTLRLLWIAICRVNRHRVLPAFAEARPASIHRPGMAVMPWFCSLFNLDHSSHMRVQRTKILVIARCREGEGKAVVGIQRFRSKLAGRDHVVRNVIVVRPGHRRAHLYRQLYRRECEVVHRHDGIFGSGMSSAKKQGDCRSHHHQASATQSYWDHLSSLTLQWRVDDRQGLITWLEVDARNTEQSAKLVVADLHRAGRGGRAGRRLRKRGRTRGVEGDVALDLLHHLVNVTVQYRHRAKPLEVFKRAPAVLGAPAPGGIDRPQWDMGEHDDRS